MNARKNRNMNLLILLSFMFLVFFFGDQTVAGNIMGTLFRADTHEPLIRAKIFIEINDSLIGAFTDLRGAFNLKDVPQGEYSLNARHIGFIDRTIENIIVMENQTTNIDIELELMQIDMESIFTPEPEVKGVKNCDFENDAESIHNKQKILFEVFHINRAWGFSFKGYYITSEGYIYSYTLSDHEQIIDLDSSYSEKSIKSRYPGYKKLFAKIDSLELRRKASIINNASLGYLSEPKNACFDAGEYMFIAFDYDKISDSYKPIILYRAGDVAQKNISTCAVKLARWLNSIIFGSYEIRCGYPE